MTPLLVARGLTVHHGARRVLDAVDLAVDRGELLAVVGPNGAGKSTLVHALAGDLPLDRGRVLLDGDPVAGLRARALARRRAVLTQSAATPAAFLVEDVVAMGRAPWSGTPAAGDDHDVVAHVIDTLGIAHLVRRSVDTLSGGELARTHLARLLAQDTPLVLLDEPTAALDLGHQEQVLHLLAGVAAAGRGVVVVLHDLGLAARHAHRVVLLGDGRIDADGTPDVVLTGDRLSCLYGTAVTVVPHPLTGTPVPLAGSPVSDHPHGDGRLAVARPLQVWTPATATAP